MIRGDMTESERATFHALVARGSTPEEAREAALDGVHVEDVRKAPRQTAWPRYETEDIPCSEKDCKETVKNHYWGRVKSGWFFQKDGSAWCPEHTPDWVAAWRAKKQP